MAKAMKQHNSSTSSFNGRKGGIRVIIEFTVFMLVLFMFFWTVISPQYSDNYQASALHKMQRMEEIKEPKVVLVGDSNLAFGIRSNIIEDELGMPVVNLGLNASLPNAFNEQMARYNINEGDIVVLCNTRYNDDDTMHEYGSSLAWITIENHLELWKLIRPQDRLMMVKTWPTYMKKTVKLFNENLFTKDEDDGPAEGTYMITSMNEYGDNVYADTHPWQYQFAADYVAGVPEISDECVNRINDLNEYVTSQGATFVVTWYPIAVGEIKPDEGEFSQFEKELSERLDCDLISSYKDYYFPFESFYDTSTHLNKDGAILRSTKLAGDIRNYMSKR